MFGRKKNKGPYIAARAVEMLQIPFAAMRLQNDGKIPDRASGDDFLIAYVLGCYTTLSLTFKLKDAEFFLGLGPLFKPFFPLTYQELPYQIAAKDKDRRFHETSKLAVSETVEALNGKGALGSLQEYIMENY